MNTFKAKEKHFEWQAKMADGPYKFHALHRIYTKIYWHWEDRNMSYMMLVEI